MTVPMALRWLAQRSLPPPPLVITENVKRRAGVSPDARPAQVRHGLWLLAHALFGAGVGVAYELSPIAREDARRTLAFGAGVWGANYVLALPALSLYPSPRRDNAVRAAETFASHHIWAAAYEAIRRASAN